MTRDEILARYPHASASFIRRNLHLHADATVILCSIASQTQSPTNKLIDNSVKCVKCGAFLRDGCSCWDAKPKKPKKVYASELDRMNKTERRFFDKLTANLKGQTCQIQFNTITLRLSDGCRYTPDVSVIWEIGVVEFYEVKGPFVWSKAMNKPKMAANKFPQFKFFLAQWKDNKWTETRIMS